MPALGLSGVNNIGSKMASKISERVAKANHSRRSSKHSQDNSERINISNTMLSGRSGGPISATRKQVGKVPKPLKK